jgi:flagellar hook-associated protein 2
MTGMNTLGAAPNTSMSYTDPTTGQTSFSGLVSNINSQQIVDAIMQAKQYQVTDLNNAITANTGKITALNTLKTDTSALKNDMSLLYGAISADGSTNIFNQKTLQASTFKRPTIGNEVANTTTSQAASLVNVTAANSATIGPHVLEILQTAQAQSVRATFATAGALGLTQPITITNQSILNTTKTAASDVAAAIVAKINADPELSGRLTASMSSDGTQLVLTAKSVNDDFNFALQQLTGSPLPLTASVKTAASATTAKVVTYNVADLTGTADPTVTLGAGQDTIDFSNVACVAGDVYTFQVDDQLGTTFSVTARPGADAATVKANVLADLATAINKATNTPNGATVSGNTVVVDTAATALGSSAIGFSAQYQFGTSTTIPVSSSNTLADLQAAIAATNQSSTPSGLVASTLSVSADQQQLLVSTLDPNRALSVSFPSQVTSGTIADPTQVGSFSIQIGSPGSANAISLSNVSVGTPTDGSALAGSIQAALRANDRGGGLADLSVAYVNNAIQITDAQGRSIGSLTLNNLDGSQVAAASSAAGATTAIANQAAEAKFVLDGTVLHRDSNTVTDAIPGMTIKLMQAEPQTQITLTVQQDVASISSQITTFVNDYNALVKFINQQTQYDPTTGQLATTSVLARSSSLRSIRTVLQNIRAAMVTVGGSPYSLQSVGISEDTSGTDPTANGTLTVDQNALQSALMNSSAAVQQLFNFTAQSAAPTLTPTGFTSATQNANGAYTLKFINGQPQLMGPDGSVGTVQQTGSQYSVTSGPAAGLGFVYTGPTDSAAAVVVNMQPGVGAMLYFGLDAFTNANTGLIQQEISTLTDDNTQRQQRVTDLTARFAQERTALMTRYTNMESTLSQLSNVRNTLNQYSLSMMQRSGG